MSEARLIKAAKKHNRDAQAALYTTYQKHWFMICLRYNNHRADAEDCLQNGLVKIFSNLNQFDPDKGKFKDWSSKIIVNENLAFLRHRQKARSSEISDDYLLEDFQLPETNTLSQENLTRLIQRLPDGYRTVFNLYVLEGYDHNEIASILDISVGTSKSQLHKARKLLQKQLEVLL